MKYILKESELEALLEKVVREEVSAMINEGVLKTMGTIGGALISPFTAAGKAFVGATDILTGRKKPGNVMSGNKKRRRKNKHR